MPVELALNVILSQDPEIKGKLRQLDKLSIALQIKNINHTIIVKIENHKLLLNSSSDTKADLTVTANAIELAKLAYYPDNLFSKDIEIYGDVQFAKKLRDILYELDLDLEALIANLTGDILAYPIVHGFCQINNWMKSIHTSLEKNMAEYLREEAELLPDKLLTNNYLTNIDKIRADLERLEARVNRLKRRNNEG
ncbi:MAG: SCP2 sterol-binding domain-containing protein [Piscirickettsiaceae bacterium]|nr:SCP2 sterol-binding domain-containing protein [Piscirickettsiaceae bacterium]